MRFLSLFFSLTLSTGIVATSDAHQANTKPATTNASTQPTRDETKSLIIELPLPPAKDFSRLIAPYVKKYGVTVPVKSFEELRALQMTPDGKMHPEKPDAGPAKIDVVVPGNYGEGERSFGLLVWISPGGGNGGGGDLGRDYLDVLKKQEMIVASPRDVGNSTHSAWRNYMAVETAHALEKKYNVDPDRVYISGVSGGGKIASQAIVFFPDVFSGAICIAGANFYLNTPAEPGKIYPGFWPKTDMSIVARGRGKSRIALLTGSKDFNQPSMKAAFEAYEQDNWAHVTYLEAPDVGHGMAPVEWFEKGFAAIDAPLSDMAAGQFDAAIALEKRHKLGDACLAFESASRHGDKQSFVAPAAEKAIALRKQFAERVEAIHTLIDGKKFDQAQSAARSLKEEFAPLANEVTAMMFDQIREARKPER